MKRFVLLALWSCGVSGADDYTTAIDHMQLVFHDAFNSSFLANQGYKGNYNNDSSFPGIL